MNFVYQYFESFSSSEGNLHTASIINSLELIVIECPNCFNESDKPNLNVFDHLEEETYGPGR